MRESKLFNKLKESGSDKREMLETECRGEVSLRLFKANATKIHDHHLKMIEDQLEDDEYGPGLAEAIHYNVQTVRESQTIGVHFVNALRFVGYLASGVSRSGAYILTFPQKEKSILDKQQEVDNDPIMDYDVLHARASQFYNTKTVTALYEKLLSPAYLLNLDAYQLAIDTQVELMKTAKSEHVKTTAANSILLHLKPPEVAKDTRIEDTIAKEGAEAIKSLRDATQKLVDQQKRSLMDSSVTLREVAEGQFVDVEGDDDE